MVKGGLTAPPLRLPSHVSENCSAGSLHQRRNELHVHPFSFDGGEDDVANGIINASVRLQKGKGLQFLFVTREHLVVAVFTPLHQIINHQAPLDSSCQQGFEDQGGHFDNGDVFLRAVFQIDNRHGKSLPKWV